MHGRSLRVADVVLAGLRSGAWQTFEDDLARRLAAAQDAEPDPAALKEAGVAFRRDRGLLASADLRAWLEERAITADAWKAHLARTVATPDPQRRACDEHVAAVLRDAALCDGILGRLADALALELAAAVALDDAAPPPDPAQVGELLDAARTSVAFRSADVGALRANAEAVVAAAAAREQFARERVRERDVLRLLEEHRLDWAHVAWDGALFPSEDAAREAALCVREDGMTLTEAAALAGAPAQSAAATLEQAPRDLAQLLVSARPGDLVGPVAAEDEGGWRLLAVTARDVPDVSDPAIRDRVHGELVAEGLTRYVAGQVTRDGAL